MNKSFRNSGLMAAGQHQRGLVFFFLCFFVTAVSVRDILSIFYIDRKPMIVRITVRGCTRWILLWSNPVCAAHDTDNSTRNRVQSNTGSCIRIHEDIGYIKQLLNTLKTAEKNTLLSLETKPRRREASAPLGFQKC